MGAQTESVGQKCHKIDDVLCQSLCDAIKKLSNSHFVILLVKCYDFGLGRLRSFSRIFLDAELSRDAKKSWAY